MARPREHLEVRVLGPLDVVVGGSSVALGGQKQRAVLALLAIRPARAASADELIESLWGERPPATANTTLQVYVSRLRKLLGPDAIATEGGRYRLCVEPEHLDATRFEHLAATGGELRAAHRDGAAAVALREALAVWRGEALADFAYESWAQPDRNRLEEQRLACLEERIDADLALGRQSDLVGELDALIHEHPLRERFRGQLMLALYRSGRQAEALDVYQRTRERLVDELGIEPSAELQALNRGILNQDRALAAPAKEDGPVLRLPAAPNRLVGRRRELDELAELLGRDDIRLVTLVGPGGVGKTRLALAAAAQAADHFSGGAHWVALHAVRDAALLRAQIAQALGTDEQPEAAIGDARMLLALDNFEQIISAALDVAEILAACPRVAVLATSREPLRIAAEHEFPVAGLPTDDAIALFTERATAIRPDLGTNGEVGAICERLDRLPLALELAAARVNVLSLEGILGKMDERLSVLTRGPRDLPLRHQTIRQTIAWSCDLLDDGERSMFVRLGVFAGGCTAEASEAVCGVDLESLASLIDKSLVFRRDGARYGMLEIIREFALECLEEAEPDHETTRRHAGWFLDLAERAYANLRGGESGIWLERLEFEHDNLRAALAFAIREQETETALRLAGALSRFWIQRGYLTEGRLRLEAALSLEDRLAWRALPLRGLAIIVMEQGDLDRAHILAEEALALALDHGDEREAAQAAGLLADVAAFRGDLEGAEARYEEAAAAARRGGDDAELAVTLYNLGHVSRLRGQLDRADSLFEESLRIFGELEDGLGQGSAISGLVETAESRGDYARALVLVRQALELLVRVGSVSGVIECLNLSGNLSARTGDRERAARLWGAASGLGQSIGRAREHPMDLAVHNEAIAAARSALGDENFDRLWAEGSEFDVDAAARYALEGP